MHDDLPDAVERGTISAKDDVKLEQRSFQMNTVGIKMKLLKFGHLVLKTVVETYLLRRPQVSNT